MRNDATSKNKLIVTTSWDDGHPLDRRLAGLLSSYGVAGTFYVAPSNREMPVMGRSDLVALKHQGMEIGSHTLTHPILTRALADEIRVEVSQSKKTLEDIIGEAVPSFCYPRGEFNHAIAKAVQEAGYELARTTVAFRTECTFEPFFMPVGLQLFPHSRLVHLRHALKDGNFIGISNWLSRWHLESDVVRLSRSMFNYILKNGGIFHLWGHSWEIDRFDLWSTLREILEIVARKPDVLYLTNSQTANAVAK